MAEIKSTKVVMPKLGLIMTEANLLEWHKSDGEYVNKGEPLFSFESDKSAIEIESPASGYVHILVKVGDTVPVNTPVALLYAESGKVANTQEAPAVVNAGTPLRTRTLQPATNRGVQGLRATPKARVEARQRGFDLASLVGTGPRGMIVTADLDAVPVSPPVKATPVAERMAADCGIDLTDLTGTGPGGRITRQDVSLAIAALTAGTPKTTASSPGKTPLPLDGLRGLIAERLSASWVERPQVTLHSEVDATELVDLRNRKLTPGRRKISFNAFFVAATARALAEFPAINSQLTDKGLVHFDAINIGLAIDIERGLVVPVLKNIGKLSLLDIEAGLSDLVARTIAGKTLPEDFTGGTFTVTNLGGFGVDSFTPIINPPEAAILGIGRIKAKPVAIQGLIGVREMGTLSLSFDHRLVDGAPAARFLQRICFLVENPESLV
jgi:pyruvate dehydrogenase E2 component (dihydrolipoamide acetyltransferase)